MKKQFIKPEIKLTGMDAQQVICGSNGLTGQNNGSQIIGNGGNTSGGASSGFTGVD